MTAVLAWQFTLLGLPARLERPEALWFLAGAVVVALLWLRHLARRRRDLAVIPARLLPRMAPRGGLGRDAASGAVSLAGIAVLAVAAAQPQCGTRSVVEKRYGIDVVIALDASTSMTARDVKPSRLERAKLELSGLIDRLKGDRVGIVVFAGDAFVQCPLTTDYAAAKMILRAVRPDDLPQQGTALAPALGIAEELLQAGDRGAAGRALVVLTDGEDHEGAVDLAGERLAEQGVRIFTVGVGSTGGEPIPLLNADGSVAGYKKDKQGKTIMTRLDEAPLVRLAEVSGGKYVPSSAGDLGLGQIHDEIDRMDKAELETRLTVQYDDRYETFAWPGAALLALGLAFGEGRLRRRRDGEGGPA